MSKLNNLIKYSSVAILSSFISCYLYDNELEKFRKVKGASLVEQKPVSRLISNPRYNEIGLPFEHELIGYDGFVANYDKRLRIPVWVMEHLPGAQLSSVNKKKIDRKGFEFFEDKFIDPMFRSTLKDYFKSGYDRGHMAAAGNHRYTNPDQYSQTFSLVNIAPQVGDGFNRDVWNQLESYVRYMAENCHDLFVITGSLFIPSYSTNNKKKYVNYEVIGMNNVSVPTHFYKAVAFKRKPDANWEFAAWLMPNVKISMEKVDLSIYQVSLTQIEQYAGYRIFTGIR